MLHHHHETTVMEDGSVRIKSGPLTAAGAASAAGSHWSGSGAAAPGKGWAKLRSEARRGGEITRYALPDATKVPRACVKDVAVTTKGWCLFGRVVTRTAAFRLTETNKTRAMSRGASLFNIARRSKDSVSQSSGNNAAPAQIADDMYTARTSSARSKSVAFSFTEGDA